LESPEDAGGGTWFRRFWVRHRTAFWALHSVWALATGVAVIIIARERYGFVPWVVLFLILTWVSTLFFSRRVPDHEADGPGVAPPGFGAEATSYLTRSMYQETMFFLLPFYAYSTVIGSANIVFTGVLAVLAVLSCLDLVFDRWLRTKVVVSLLFFSIVTFAAVNLLLPLLLPLDPRLATRIAAGVAIGSALPLALRGTFSGPKEKAYLGFAALAFLTTTIGIPKLIPPVPLRLESALFSTSIDQESLALPDTLPARVTSEDLDGLLVVLTEVFAPAIVPTHVSLEWERDGKIVRVSRDIVITAHDLGFRVWDSWRPELGEIPPGSYKVLLRASGGPVFGSAKILVEPPQAAQAYGAPKDRYQR